MPHEIDNVDFSILRCVKDADQPLWKKKIHGKISEYLDTLPLQDVVSVQTVGRRIDTLEEDGYLETKIASPDEVNRELIICYDTTAEGEQVLEARRRLLLRRVVGRELFGEERFDINKRALEILIRNEFTAGLSIDATNGYSRKQLLLLLGMYFIEHDMADAFPAEKREQLRDAVGRTSADLDAPR